MNILGFDTSLNKTYLALESNGNVISEVIESTKDKYHSAFLVKKIVEILKNNTLKPQDIALLATNIGPGSFTGIRVGLTIARAFAQSINAKAIGINSLELISTAHGLPAITILDARKNKAYTGNDNFVKLEELENLKRSINHFTGKIIADNKMAEYLAQQGIKSINFENENIDYGKILLEIAKQKYSNGEFTQWQGLKPLYIQPPPIHQKTK